MWVLLDFTVMFPAQEDGGAAVRGRKDVIGEPAVREAFLREVLVPLVSKHEAAPEVAGDLVSSRRPRTTTRRSDGRIRL